MRADEATSRGVVIPAHISRVLGYTHEMSSHHPFLTLFPLAVLLAACPPVTVDKEETGQPPIPNETADDTGDPLPDSQDTGCDPTDTGLPVFYRDVDGDSYGNAAVQIQACEQPEGYVDRAGDCDDASSVIHPGAAELCNDADEDCDDLIDEDFDADADGHTNSACANGDDCDDTNAAIYPGADESCGDDVDADCDGQDTICGYEEDLEAADGKRYAEGRSDDAGRHMDAGDIDGDGIEDVVTGAMWAYGYTGSAWVNYGPITGSSSFDSDGYELTAGSGGYEAGRTVGVYDVDADGYADIFLGSPDASVYDAVVFISPITEDLAFSEADLRASCSTAVECGHGGDLADIDGDGTGDVIIGAGEEVTGGYYSGSVYVVFGPIESRSMDIHGSADVELVGDQDGSETGRVITAGEDLDGDGVQDMLVTASYDTDGGPYAGAVHVVLGPVTDDGELADSDGKLLGNGAYDYAGESLAMGDVDGDGLSDAIVGTSTSASGAGRTYVVLGPATGETSLRDADVGFRGSSSEGLGTSIVSGRDLDEDGYDELMIGAGTDSSAGSSAGAAYLYFGPLSGSLSPSDADFGILGEERSDAAGTGVGFGDLDGNGRADLLIGATGDSTGAMSAGALYVLYTED